MRSRAVRILATSALVLIGLVIAWRLGRGMVGIDFYQFWAGAQVAREGEAATLYSPETRRSAAAEYLRRATEREQSSNMLVAASRRPVFEFYSTPFLYTTFGLFTGRYERDYLVYRIAVIGAFAAGVTCVGLAAGLSLPKILLALAFLLILCEPFASEVRVSNVNSIQLAVFGAALYLARRSASWPQALSATILGLLVAFKPNVLFVLPAVVALRVMRRDFRRLSIEVAGFAAGAAAAVVAGAIYFRSWRSWVEWAGAARELAGGYLPLSAGNVSPALVLIASFGGAISAAIAVALLAIMIYALWKGGKAEGGQRLPDETALVASFGLVIYLCAASLVWMHYLILAIPLAIILLSDPVSSARRWLALIALTLISYTVWHKVFAIRTMQGQAVVFWIGLAILIATSIHRLTWPLGLPLRRRNPPGRQRRRG